MKGFEKMKRKKKQNEVIKKPKKQRKTPTIRVGTHRKLTIALWVLLLASVSFGVYKNFTAIDIHTVHEKEIIEQRVVDTNKIESFVKDFASEYFSWGQGQEAVDHRNERLKAYLSEELGQLNLDMIRADIPTTSHMSKVQIWQVEQASDTAYTVTFSVDQQITENEATTLVTSTYNVVVHMDNANNMVIIKNPTMDRKPQKSAYQPPSLESDGTIDASTSEEISSFLETFFKLYPTASEKELAYYVSDNALPAIHKDYMFAELINPIYIRVDDTVKVMVTVKYLDQATKSTQLSQYELTLQKGDNWKIIE
jgi:hypothetical protein